MSGENLDRLCAQYGFQIVQRLCSGDGMKAKDAENLITKSLGVLQENGLYAFFLFQRSRGKPGLGDCSADMLRHKTLSLKSFAEFSEPLEAIRGNEKKPGLASNLDDYMLAKSLLQQALIYARYHAKAFETEASATARQAQES